MIETSASWPALDWAEWRETAIGLQLRAQVIGKVRLALTPWLNHSWHVPLYVTWNGFTTSPISCGDRILEINFNLLGELVVLATSDGDVRTIALRPGSIADFHTAVVTALADLGVTTSFDG